VKIRRKKSKQTKINKIFPVKDRNNNIDNELLYKTSSSHDVILLIGQSNSANSVISKAYSPSKHLNYFNKKTYLLTNPVLGANGDKHCIAPAIAKKLKSRKPIIFLTNGWGGTSIYDWSHPKSMLTKYVSDNLKNLLKKHHLKYIIWIQGESDNNTDVDYVKEFKIFRQNLLKGQDRNKLKKLKYIITQTTICGTTRDKTLNDQQKKLGEEKIIIVTNITDNLDINYRFDDCHFNKFGTERIASEIAKIINKSS